MPQLQLDFLSLNRIGIPWECDSQSKMIKDLGGFNDVMQHSEPM